MAHKKGQGTSSNGRDSHSKRLGVKVYGGQSILAGGIIMRQRGSKYRPGAHVGVGKDWTLYALKDGSVKWDAAHRRVSVVEAGVVAPKSVVRAPKAAKAPKARTSN